MEFEGRKLLFSLLAGSHAHGTATAESDEDLRGVVMPLFDEVLGLKRFEMLEKKHEADVVMYSLHKYMQLLVMKGNPNVHEWLWTREYRYMSSLGQKLVDLRERWMSGKLFKTGLGYLNGQVKRMLHIRHRDLGAKRKRLVEAFGYDTKNAACAVRIARELVTLAETGVLEVWRENDSEELLAIRAGSLTLDQAYRLIHTETLRAEKAIEENRAGIRDKPDVKFANEWLVEVMRKYLNGLLIW